MQCGSIFFPFSHLLLFILSIRNSHMMSSLATSLITILRRLRQSSGSLNAGELVSCPQRGVLQLFTHKDAWRVLINKHICCHRHLEIAYSSSSSCTCISKMKFHCSCQSCALVNLDLFLWPPSQLTMLLQFSVCAYVCVRVPVCKRARVCQRGNTVSATLRCITPCLMTWFVIAVSQALLLLSQCRAISSVVIAKQMKKRKKIEKQVMMSSSFFQCSNVSTFL